MKAADIGETPDESSADVARSLQDLRSRSGATYADIAMRIAALRVAAGVSPSAARVARSTVFDAFKADRARLNPALVAEIATVLGEDDAAVASWRERATKAALVRRDPAPHSEKRPQVATDLPAAATLPPLTAPATTARAGWWERHSVALILLTVCIAANLLGHRFVSALQVPLFFDMMGTAIASIALGPWHGVLVAVATNVVGMALSNPASIFFTAVNVAGALLWGYGVRRFGMGRTVLRFLLLNLLVAFVCSVIAAAIIVFALSGTSHHPLDDLARSWMALGQGLLPAVFSSNLVTSVADKLIAGFVTLVVLGSLGPVADRISLPRDTVFRRLQAPTRATARAHEPQLTRTLET